MKYVVYEKIANVCKNDNGVVLGVYDNKEDAEKAKMKYYPTENYYVDLYNYPTCQTKHVKSNKFCPNIATEILDGIQLCKNCYKTWINIKKYKKWKE